MTSGDRTLEQWRERAVAFMRANERGGPDVIEANAAILDLDRSDHSARTRLGFAYRLEGDFDSAEAVYRKILESSHAEPTYVRIAEKALLMLERERSGRTRTFSLQSALAAIVNADDAYQRASALRDDGKLELALRWVERGLGLAEKQGRAKQRRGFAVRASILRRMGDSSRALEDARASVALGLAYKDNPSAFTVLTACLGDLGEVDEAVAVAEMHLENDVDSVYAMNTAGRAFLASADRTGELGLVERGERCFRLAAQLEASKAARAQLATIVHRYRKMGLSDRACELEAFLKQLAR